ncbi:MAG: DUF4418 family protein [Clostridiales Family XIII bacterium]|nr:DUF4418 family protein [Clostridiales Family XIII bacterium]
MSKSIGKLGIFFGIIGLIIAIVPSAVYQTYENMDMGGMHMAMACKATASAEVVTGLVIFALGLVYIFVKNVKVRLGASFANILAAATAILLPTAFTGICKGHEMACNVITKPSLIVAGILLIIGSAIGVIIQINKIHAKDESIQVSEDAVQ